MSDDTEDKVPFQGDSFQCLGLTAVPAPKNDNGSAELLVGGPVGGLNEVAIGGRDTRSAPKLGGLKPGDTVLHSTDPETDSQFGAMGKDRKAVMFAREADGTMAMLMIDAKNKVFQFAGFEGFLQYSKDGGWEMRDSTGKGFTINGGQFQLNAGLAPALPPKGPLLALAPGAAPPPGSVPIPGWFGMVAHLYRWFMWWLWQKLPKLEAT